MAEECTCKAGNTILLPCSGNSNCGRISYEVAVSLDISGIGQFYSLAGIGAHIDKMVESARGAGKVVAIDGCEIACARKTIEHAGITVTDWLCISKAGVVKNNRLLPDQEQIELSTEYVKKKLKG
jgi:uncharacterized metal-binding protein